MEKFKEIEFDYLLNGGNVINVVSGGYIKADMGLLDGVIAAVGDLSQVKAKQTINVNGKFLAPGFIDAHVHIESSMVAPAEFAKAVLVHGTTAVIADPHEIVNVGGAEALDAFIKMCKGAAIDVFTAVPSSVPATPFDTNGAGEFLAKDMQKYVSMPEIVGLGEVMCYPEVFSRDKKIMDKINLFKDKTIDGHAVGITREKISEYASAGIDNDHECTSFAEAELRLNAGMNVYLREGSAAHNQKDILSGILEYNKVAENSGEERISLDRLAFCTDDKHLSTVKISGHIDENIRMAIALGIGLSEAVKIAAYNPAKFYKLDGRGALEIGFKADIAVLSDEKATEVDYVFKNGMLAAKDGKLDPDFVEMLVPSGSEFLSDSNCKFNTTKRSDKPAFMQNTVKYKRFSASDFDKKAEGVKYAIELQNGQLITKLLTLSDEQAGKANLAATIERYGKNGNFSVCRLCGYDIKNGAVATSVSHDSHNVVVAGDNAADMACAANRLKEIGGGYVVSSGGKIIGELRLDIAGLMSSESADVVSKNIAELGKIAAKLGVNPEIDPFTTLSFIALPVIPSVRLLDTGLFNVDKMEFIK